QIVSPTAGVAQSLGLEQIRFTQSESLLHFVARMNVGEQVVPPDDPAVGIAQRKAARLEPTVLAIAASDPVLEVVRLPCLDGVLPGGLHARQIGRVNGVRSAPLPQFVKSPPKIIEHLAVHMLDLTGRRHDGYEAGDRLDDEAKALLAHTMHFRSSPSPWPFSSLRPHPRDRRRGTSRD